MTGLHSRTLYQECCDYAIYLCGNPGVGKSTLLNALGANFAAGFSYGGGLTKDVSCNTVAINGDIVMAIDAPGLYEISKERTLQNAKAIHKALGFGLPYKIAFVVDSNGGRFQPQDVAIIDQVVKSVKTWDDSPIEYVLIINKIQKEDWEHYMDDEKLDEMVQKLLAATTSKPKFSTTLCLPYIPSPSKDEMLKKKLQSAFEFKLPFLIERVDEIKADPDDLKVYQKVLLVIFSPIWGPIFGLYAAFSSIKNKIRYDDWHPFTH